MGNFFEDIIDPFGVVEGTLSGLGSLFGVDEQQAALDRAAASLTDAERARLGLSREQFEFAKELIAEGKPIRDALVQSGLDTISAFSQAALDALELIKQDVTREPGTSPLFRTGLRRGTEAISRELAPFGLTDSSVQGEAVGELAEGLLARDIESIRGGRFRLAGFAPEPRTGSLSAGVGLTGAATNLIGQAGQLAQQRAGLFALSPSARFRQGIFSDLTRGIGFGLSGGFGG